MFSLYEIKIWEAIQKQLKYTKKERALIHLRNQVQKKEVILQSSANALDFLSCRFEHRKADTNLVRNAQLSVCVGDVNVFLEQNTKILSVHRTGLPLFFF